MPMLERAAALSRLHRLSVLVLFCAGLSYAVLGCAVLGCREHGGEPAASDPASGNRPLVPSPHSAAVVSRTADVIAVTDLLGRRVVLRRSPQRIVSLSPSLTEILFAIGAGDRIVGATEFCDYPPETIHIPHVGGGTMESINQEIIVGLQPDLVLCKEDTHEPLLRNLERLEIPVLALGPDTMEQLYGHTEMLGEITGHTDRAAALVESMQRRVAAVAARLPDGERPTIFYQVWDEPLMTAGADSYIGEVLRLAGGRNLFEDSPIRYPKVSREVVVSENPDVILAPGTHSTPVTLDIIRSRPGWSQIRAVRENRVYVINGDLISRCGPRLIDALEEIVGLLYPDRFPPTASESTAIELPQKASPANSESQERLP